MYNVNRMLRELAMKRAGHLANFLNATQGMAKHKNVLRVLELTRRLQAFTWKAPPDFDDPQVQAAEIKRGILEGDLDKALELYKFRPAVSSLYQFSVHWVPVGRHHLTKREIAAWKLAQKLPIGEIGSVQVILDLASQGLLDRVRQCEAPHRDRPTGRCGNWFVAVNNKKAVCGDSCRVRKGQDSDEFRKKRREYMQNYNSRAACRKRRMKAGRN